MTEHAKNEATRATSIEDLEVAAPSAANSKPYEDRDAQADRGDGNIHAFENEPSPWVTERNRKRQIDESGEAADQSIEKVRDILFGSQTRRIEQRFANLETVFKQEITDLRGESKKNLEALEDFAKNEMESMSDSINAEKKTRTEAVEGLEKKLNDTIKTLEQKIEQLDQTISSVKSNMQEQILEQSKTLREEMSEKFTSISKVHEQAFNELRKEKSDSLALANLFIEMGMRLKEEFDIPGMG